MRFSLQLFGLPTDHFGPVVKHAEELGYEVVWLSDHVVTPLSYERRYPYTDDGDPGYDINTPLADVTVMLSHLAAQTSTIKLAAGVYVLPMRNAFHVASAWGTLQNISGCRAILGIGSGWMEEEFTAVGVPFRGRGRRLDEMLDVIDLLWSGEPVEFDGEHYRFDPIMFGVRPECSIPKVFGGHGDRALRRVARRGDGWFGPNVDLATSLGYCDTIEQLRRDYRRHRRDFTYYVRLHGSPESSLVDEYEAAGVSHVVISPFATMPTGTPLEGRLDHLRDVSARLGVAAAARATTERTTS